MVWGFEACSLGFRASDAAQDGSGQHYARGFWELDRAHGRLGATLNPKP